MDKTRRGNLVISRRQGQSFQIGEEITVEIIEVSDKKVRIGIRAPINVPVLRHDALVTVPVQSR